MDRESNYVFKLAEIKPYSVSTWISLLVLAMVFLQILFTKVTLVRSLGFYKIAQTFSGDLQTCKVSRKDTDSGSINTKID